MNAFLAWILKYILDLVIARAEKEARAYFEKVMRDKERGEINEGNIDAYKKAQDRVDKARIGAGLINGTRSTD